MVLVGLRRSAETVLVVCPILLVAAALPTFALLGLPWLALAALRDEQGVSWAFVALYAFFVGIPAYAFGKAARAQQVHCARAGSHLRVKTRAHQLEADVDAVQLVVTQRRVGGARPLTLHEVTLRAPYWKEAVALHSGLTPWFAKAAERRLRSHLRLVS